MIKVACYIRVSTQEQKLHGISLDAQKDKLTEYAERHNLKIVGWYADEGVSGRKLIKHRPELQRMLHDAHNRKFDRIIFIKLDRFFRSVAEYHECMKYIDPVLWTATEEKYDLTTANGRAFVNMKLTIAELEADQTSERIKLVNEYKVKTGQALMGTHNHNFAFKVVKIDGVKRVVKDEEVAHIVSDAIDYFLVHQGKRKTVEYIINKYNIHFTYKMLTSMLNSTLLCGYYRDNPNYCEPYIDKETFDKIQSIIESKNIKTTRTNRVYLFTGLMRCPKCGIKLSGNHVARPKYNKEYYTYRCNNSYRDVRCSFKKAIPEIRTEKFLLEEFNAHINEYITHVNITDNRADVDNEQIDKQIKDIKLEMKNTTTAFRKGRMTEKEYDREYEELEMRLNELQVKLAPKLERDLSEYEALLKSDWIELYSALTKENKRAFWRKYIKEIVLNKDSTIKELIFF